MQLSLCGSLLFQSIFPPTEAHNLEKNKNEVCDAISFLCVCVCVKEGALACPTLYVAPFALQSIVYSCDTRKT